MAFTIKPPTCTFPSTILPSQHVCSDWLGRLCHPTVFNDDDSTAAISHHNQHFEVFSNIIPYTVILATVSVAPPWPTIKRAEYLQYTLQHSCTTVIFTKRWSLVNTCIQMFSLSSLWPSTNIGHSSAWWQQTSSSTNESEFCCSNKFPHILQTSSRSITASKFVQLHPIWSFIATGLFAITHVGMFINHHNINIHKKIVTRSVQYRLSVLHVTKKKSQKKQPCKPIRTVFYQTKRKVWQKKQKLYKSILPSMQMMMLTTSKGKNQSPHSFFSWHWWSVLHNQQLNKRWYL